jgi:ribosomal protein L11 methyltransferase
MAWQALSVYVDGAIAEALSDALVEAGAVSVSIEDADAGTAAEDAQFGEPGSPPAEPWPHSQVCALFANDANTAHALDAAARAVGLGATPRATLAAVADEDWVQRTQGQFEPIKISERLWIVPSWHEPPDPRAINLALDPGMAFGTGSHPTTRLCLEWLEARMRGGETVIDYGCGSGVLAIAAAKLGAARVIGLDIDPRAVEAAHANARRNGVDGTFIDGDTPLTVRGDLVLANILANPLLVLAPLLARLTRSSGRLVLSGLLSEQIEEVTAAYAPYFVVTTFGERDGWAAVEGIRR